MYQIYVIDLYHNKEIEGEATCDPPPRYFWVPDAIGLMIQVSLKILLLFSLRFY